MSDNQRILDKLDAMAADVAQIKGALWPDEGQPSRITEAEHRLDKLEGWRNYLVGGWAVLSAGLLHYLKHVIPGKP